MYQMSSKTKEINKYRNWNDKKKQNSIKIQNQENVKMIVVIAIKLLKKLISNII